MARKAGTLAIFLIAAFAAMVVIGQYVGPGPTAMKAAAHEVVRTLLRDPASAVFSGEVVREAPDLPDASYREFHVCGEVNARNGFGGMSGAIRYAYSSTINKANGQIARGLATLETLQAGRYEAFAEHWTRACLSVLQAPGRIPAAQQ